MLLQMTLFHSFLWLSNSPSYIYTPHLLYPFICWLTFRLFLCLGCCKEHRKWCFSSSFLFYVKGIWVAEVNSEPGTLGSNFTLVTSFLRHLGQVISPLRPSGPWPVEWRNGNRPQRVPATQTSCDYFQDHVLAPSQKHLHPFLFGAPCPLPSPRSLPCFTEPHGRVPWALALDKTGLQTNLHPTH